jgi:hypothetical protein
MPKLSYSKLYDNTVDNITNSKSINDICNALWDPYYKTKSRCTKTLAKGMKILILNAPCNGFGDLIFALKLSNYLVQWYGADVTLATTLEKGLLSLGADPKYVVGLVGGKNTQCRKFARLELNKQIPQQDLILVAPIQIDFSPDLKDVQKIIPYANIWNTFSFSEYNDTMKKKFTFNTGVGGGRDGILLTKPIKTKGKPVGLKNPYAVIYVADSLEGVGNCILSFVEMIAKKYYTKHKKLDIVIPPWFVKNTIETLLKKKVSKYYPNIFIISKDETYPIAISTGFDNDNYLTFRCDILPVPNNLMMQLMSNSINDILLTGDQSITDALSCCSKKNIFYQIAPWKSDLAKNLATYMPNIHLKKVTTSCGSLKAISYKSDYTEFVKKWDFRKLGKPKLDAIVLSILAIQKNNSISELSNIVTLTKTLPEIKRKINDTQPVEKSKTSRSKTSRSRSKTSRSRSKTSRSRSKTSRSRSKTSRSKTSRSRSKTSRSRSKTSRSKTKCPYGEKKLGGCKNKPGPKIKEKN